MFVAGRASQRERLRDLLLRGSETSGRSVLGTAGRSPPSHFSSVTRRVLFWHTAKVKAVEFKATADGLVEEDSAYQRLEIEKKEIGVRVHDSCRMAVQLSARR